MKILRSIFGLLLIAAVGLGGWKVVPVYIANFQLEDAMDTASRAAAGNPAITDDQIRANMAHQALALQLPISPEQILIERMAGDVYVSGEYTAHVDLFSYALDLHFHPMSKNKKRSME